MVSKLVDIPIAPGVLTEETARGALGRYKDGDMIRFRQLLPEKIGGWVLSSLGSSNGDIEHETNQYTGLGATFAATDTSVTLESQVTVSDGDPVWLFGTSKTGGWGTRSISDAAAVKGAFIFDLDSNVTAALADAIVIDAEPPEMSVTVLVHW